MKTLTLITTMGMMLVLMLGCQEDSGPDSVEIKKQQVLDIAKKHGIKPEEINFREDFGKYDFSLEEVDSMFKVAKYAFDRLDSSTARNRAEFYKLKSQLENAKSKEEKEQAFKDHPEAVLDWRDAIPLDSLGNPIPAEQRH